LTATDITQLNAAADAAQAANDPGFASALHRVAAGETPVRAPIGIGQIAEISATAALSAGPPATLVWNGPVSPDQRQTLVAWRSLPQTGTVFQSLLDQFDGFLDSENFDASEEWPRDNELPRVLAGRLSVTSGTANWAGLDLDSAQQTALQNLSADGTFGPTFRGAVQKILTALENAKTAAIALPSGWKPRPATGDLLADKLLIGNAAIEFHGVMSRDEAAKLASGQLAPDAAAIGELFSASQSAGLNGAAIEIRARLGTAAVSRLTPIDSSLA
jgi:hypothetical protein